MKINPKQKVSTQNLLFAVKQSLRVKKNSLLFEPEYDFSLFALVGPMKGFRLCWMLDQKLNLHLHRLDDLELTSKRDKQTLYFQLFEHQPPIEEEENYLRYTLVGNKTSNGFLIPEQKVVDYYLKLEGEFSEKDIDSVKYTLSLIPELQHVFEVNPETLKSKKNLIL